jgi:Domain of unknown function (DUF5047)
MLAVTPEFLAALRGPHVVAIAATIIPPTGAPAEAPIIGGSLRMDRDARVRRQGSLVVAHDLEANLDYLRELPFGGYVRIERGVRFPDGTLERPTIGMLRVGTVSWSRPTGEATLELADRMAQIQDEPFPFPWAPAGLKPSDAAVQAVRDVFGATIAYHVSTDPASEPALADNTVYDQDRAQAIGDLASGVHAVARFDAAGDFLLAPAPGDIDGAPLAWTIDVGPTGVLTEVAENLDRSAVRNGVAVRGQADSTSPPFYALAVDDDPASPTRWGGPFGKVAVITSSTSIGSQEQADATAASLLNIRLGLARAVTLRGVPNPALEPDDVILARYPDDREERLLVNSVQLPLEPDGAMDVGATGHFRPAALRSKRDRPRLRVYRGPGAWRELADARLVPA